MRVDRLEIKSPKTITASRKRFQTQKLGVWINFHRFPLLLGFPHCLALPNFSRSLPLFCLLHCLSLSPCSLCAQPMEGDGLNRKGLGAKRPTLGLQRRRWVGLPGRSWSLGAMAMISAIFDPWAPFQILSLPFWSLSYAMVRGEPKNPNRKPLSLSLCFLFLLCNEREPKSLPWKS